MLTELDIVLVTYNSEVWVERCVGSLARSRVPLEKLNVLFVDNAFSDATAAVIERVILQYGDRFGSIKLIQNKTNTGFGAANNAGATQGNSDYILNRQRFMTSSPSVKKKTSA